MGLKCTFGDRAGSGTASPALLLRNGPRQERLSADSGCGMPYLANSSASGRGDPEQNCGGRDATSVRILQLFTNLVDTFSFVVT